MNFKKGIYVLSSLANINNQLFINSGAIPALNISGFHYEDGAHIPKNDWRCLTDKERSLLAAKSNESNYSKSIYVGEISPELKQLFLSLNFDECQNPDDVYPKFRENEIQTKKITQYFHDFFCKCSSLQKFKFHRITRAMPNKQTLTYHYYEERFIYTGLHIDQSRLFRIHTAHQSGNRISINLSQEERALCFINLTLIQALNLLKQKIDVKKIDINADNIAFYFFKYYPNYPVIKLVLKPYQYYVAPTDNFFHDASTLGNKHMDITIVYTGIFDMPQFTVA